MSLTYLVLLISDRCRAATRVDMRMPVIVRAETETSVHGYRTRRRLHEDRR